MTLRTHAAQPGGQVGLFALGCWPTLLCRGRRAQLIVKQTRGFSIQRAPVRLMAAPLLPPPRRHRRRRAAGGEQQPGEELPSSSSLVEQLMNDPENQARMQRVTEAAQRVAELQAESQRLAAAMAEAEAAEAATAEQRERRAQEAASQLIAEAEVAAKQKLLQAAQLEAEAAAAAQRKWAADIGEVPHATLCCAVLRMLWMRLVQSAAGFELLPVGSGEMLACWMAGSLRCRPAVGVLLARACQPISACQSCTGNVHIQKLTYRLRTISFIQLQDAERLESAKAAAAAAAGGAAATLPLVLSGGAGAGAALLSLAAAGVASALLGVTYRYAVRQDLGNTQLKVRAVGLR